MTSRKENGDEVTRTTNWETFIFSLGNIQGAPVSGNDILHRILRTTKEMLHDRGYTIITMDGDIEKHIMENKYVLSATDSNNKRILHVYIHSEDKIGIKYARLMIGQSSNAQILCISIDGPTPFTKKDAGDRIQYMSCNRLCANLTKHCLVPKHERIGVDGHNFEKDKLPKLLVSDPIVQYYDWKVGDVIRIRRVFGGGEPHDYYRVVC